MNSFNLQSGSPEKIVVVDIGGTWFRSGTWTSRDGVKDFSAEPAASFVRFPHDSSYELQRRLLDYILTAARRLSKTVGAGDDLRVSISMGAALDARTGLLLNNGPLWGPKSEPMDLLSELQRAEPFVSWTVMNDVSAALLGYAQWYAGESLSKISLITVSTGIASRTFDYRTNSIPVGRRHGLQGEIGHLAIDFRLGDSLLERFCDCGGKNHLNAFSSGRGIEAIVSGDLVRSDDLPASYLSLRAAIDVDGPGQDRIGSFARLLHGNFEPAQLLLDDLTRPLAGLILQQLTIDPLVERVILVGGVVDGIPEHYRRSILRNLEAGGMYQVSNRDPDFFADTVVTEPRIESAGLIGAGIAAISENMVDRPGHSSSFRWSVQSSKSVEYQVDLLSSEDRFESTLNESLRSPFSSNRQVLIVDAKVYQMHERRLDAFVASRVPLTQLFALDVSEDAKNLTAVRDCLRIFQSEAVPRRSSPILAIGGGVLLDIVGTAAGLFRRGIDYIRVPTTLLGQVDAGVGVKVGVNFTGEKNRIGLYHAPLRSIVDTSFLNTLPERELRSGVAEILKIAIMCDPALFYLVESQAESMIAAKFQDSASMMVIKESIENMVDELAPNLWEAALARAADFGHTFGPRIELYRPGSILHGESVAIDMALSVLIGEARGVTPTPLVERIIELLRRLRFDLMPAVFDVETLMGSLDDAARHRGGLQRLPVPSALGRPDFLEHVSPDEVEVALTRLRRINVPEY